MVSQRKLILIPTLVFWISNQKSIWGKFGLKKSKLSVFCLKIDTHRGCWFLFQHFFSEFQTKNRFLAKFRPKKSNLSILPENMVSRGCEFFWAELFPASEIACFVWCSYTTYPEGADLFHQKSVTGEEGLENEVCNKIEVKSVMEAKN